MSDQRRIVPSETPSARAAWEVESPRGLSLIGSIHPISAVMGSVGESRLVFAQPFRTKVPCGHPDARMHSMRLRLYHHHDGARVAYRETGTGPALTLLHSLGLSHREREPIVAPPS